MAQRPLTVLAFDGDDDNQLSKDTLKLVNNQVNQSTGTVTLKAKFANRNAALCLG
jgi:multidrug efflux system membrane fusion protein